MIQHIDNQIGIVITSKNEEKNISNILSSIQFQKGLNKIPEVCLVDNNSNDLTKEVAKKFNFCKIYNSGPERSSQRNFGVRKLNTKFILILDADMICSPFLLYNLNMMFRKYPKINAAHIKEVILGKNLINILKNYERFFYENTVIDACRVFNRNFFIKIGGYDTNLTGPEDWDLDNRIRDHGENIIILNKIEDNALFGYNILDDLIENIKIDYSCLYHNENKIKFKDYIEKKKYYSRAMKKYIKKWGTNNDYIKKQLGFKYRFFNVFFRKNCFRYIFFNLHKFILMYALIFLKSFTYILNK